MVNNLAYEESNVHESVGLCKKLIFLNSMCLQVRSIGRVAVKNFVVCVSSSVSNIHLIPQFPKGISPPLYPLGIHTVLSHHARIIHGIICMFRWWVGLPTSLYSSKYPANWFVWESPPAILSSPAQALLATELNRFTPPFM